MKTSIPKLRSIKWKNGIDGLNVHVMDNRIEALIPSRDTLTNAYNKDLEKVIVLGFYNDGEEYFSSNMPDLRDVNWLIDRLKARLIHFEDYVE